VRVELREEVIRGQKIQREHECLIAIVAGSEVSFAKRVRQRELRALFAIAEYSKLRFS
jgi:hypothetical protein